MGALSNVTEVEDDVIIQYNEQLGSLNGLNGLTTIGGDIAIMGNPALTNMNAFSTLSSLGGDLKIRGNNMLTSLNGFEGISSTSGGIQIVENNNLTTLDGLQNITAIGANRPIEIGTTAYSENLPNANLTDFCAIKDLLLSGQHGDVYINNNAYNPTESEIESGDCNL